jgi:hypothetical protein
MVNDLVTPCVTGQENEELDSSKTFSVGEKSNEKSPVEMVLAAFWDLFNKEKRQTEKVLKACLKRAYWEVVRPERLSYADLEEALINEALALMTSARFKADMAKIGNDYYSNAEDWYVAYVIASYFVLSDYETIQKYKRRRKDTPLRSFIDDGDGPLIDMRRLFEEADIAFSPIFGLFWSFFPDEESIDRLLDVVA